MTDAYDVFRPSAVLPCQVGSHPAVPTECRLFAAILEDASNIVSGKRKPEARYAERITNEAIAWFVSDGKHVGSFLWVCDILSLEPGYLRRFVATESLAKAARRLA